MILPQKKSFVIYKDCRDTFNKLNLIQKGKLLTAIMDYQANIQFDISDSMVDLVFSQLEKQFERDDQKYSDTCEKRRLAANKRWNTNE